MYLQFFYHKQKIYNTSLDNVYINFIGYDIFMNLLNLYGYILYKKEFMNEINN